MAKVILITSLSLLAAVRAAGVPFTPAASEGAWRESVANYGAARPAWNQHTPRPLVDAVLGSSSVSVNRIEALEFSSLRAEFDPTPNAGREVTLRAAQGADAAGATDWSVPRVAVLPAPVEIVRSQRVHRAHPRDRKFWPPWRPLNGAQARPVLKQP